MARRAARPTRLALSAGLGCHEPDRGASTGGVPSLIAVRIMVRKSGMSSCPCTVIACCTAASKSSSSLSALSASVQFISLGYSRQSMNLRPIFSSLPCGPKRSITGTHQPYRQGRGGRTSGMQGVTRPPRTTAAQNECRSRANDQHPNYQLGVDRWSADLAVERHQLLANVTQYPGHNRIDPAQQMTRRNAPFEIEKVKQPALIAALPTHHDPTPPLKTSTKRNHNSPIISTTFSTWGNSGIEPDKGTGNQLFRNV